MINVTICLKPKKRAKEKTKQKTVICIEGREASEGRSERGLMQRQDLVENTGTGSA